MTEIKIDEESINNGDTAWEVNLYRNGIFVKRICTCYEKEYVDLIARAIAKTHNIIIN